VEWHNPKTSKISFPPVCFYAAFPLMNKATSAQRFQNTTFIHIDNEVGFFFSNILAEYQLCIPNTGGKHKPFKSRATFNISAGVFDPIMKFPGVPQYSRNPITSVGML